MIRVRSEKPPSPRGIIIRRSAMLRSLDSIRPWLHLRAVTSSHPLARPRRISTARGEDASSVRLWHAGSRDPEWRSGRLGPTPCAGGSTTWGPTRPWLITTTDAGWVEGYVRTVTWDQLTGSLDSYEGVGEGLYRRVSQRRARAAGLDLRLRPAASPVAVGPLDRWNSTKRVRCSPARRITRRRLMSSPAASKRLATAGPRPEPSTLPRY